MLVELSFNQQQQQQVLLKLNILRVRKFKSLYICIFFF